MLGSFGSNLVLRDVESDQCPIVLGGKNKIWLWLFVTNAAALYLVLEPCCEDHCSGHAQPCSAEVCFGHSNLHCHWFAIPESHLDQCPLGIEQFRRHECRQDLGTRCAQALIAEVSFGHGGVDGDWFAFFSAAVAAKRQRCQCPTGIWVSFGCHMDVQKTHRK